MEDISNEANELSPPPAQQLASTTILRGFDPESGIATFSHEVNGKVQEFSAAINKKRPNYSRLYEMLLSNLGRDGNVPALDIRIAVSNDGAIPELLFAVPVVTRRRDQRFIWRGIELKWTEELDNAVDVDFDWCAHQFAQKFLEDQINDPKNFQSIRSRAFEIFAENSAKSGLDLSSEQLRTLFDRFAPGDINQVIAGRETSAGGSIRGVRYDPRYSFDQQNGHVGRDANEVASSLVNYAFQVGIVDVGAMAASNDVTMKNGKTGSLAEAHQLELVAEQRLIAQNPNVSSYREIFALYSHEEVRTQLLSILGGAMDAAGVPAARPEIDFTEHQKQLAPDKSQHHIVLSEMPDEARNSQDPTIRAGAYIAAARNVGDSFRDVSRREVAIVQSRNVPRQKDLSKKDGGELILAEKFKQGVKKLEDTIDFVFGP